MFASSLALVVLIGAPSAASPEPDGAQLAAELLVESDADDFDLGRARARFAFLPNSEQGKFLDSWKRTAEPSEFNLRLYLMFKDTHDGFRTRLPRLAHERRAVGGQAPRTRLPFNCVYPHGSYGQQTSLAGLIVEAVHSVRCWKAYNAQ